MRTLRSLVFSLVFVAIPLSSHSEESYSTGRLPAGYLPSSHLKEVISDYGKLSKECPAGMIDMGGFCIDESSFKEETWTSIAQKCHDEKKRLCLHDEWFISCMSYQKGESEIQNIGVSPEWINDFSYINGSFKPLMRGFQGNCYLILHQWPGAQEDIAHGRCCASK